MISFLPDTSRDTDGNLVVMLGETFSDVVLVLKRTVFDGMKQEEEDIIEVEIRQLMAKTMAAATAPTKREEYEIQENIAEWKAMGVKAYASDPAKYANAKRYSLGGYEITGAGEVVVDDCFLSADTFIDEDTWTGIIVADTVTGIKWHADLPCLQETSCNNIPQCITEWTGKIPNVTNASYMFAGCTGLKSWTVALPNSLTDASFMFQDCSGLKSWTVALPNSLTTAHGMFSGCSGLTEWTVALPNGLTDASMMFYKCSGLTEWTVALPNNLTNAQYMFYGCTGLTSWSVALSDSITNAYQMFHGCSGLTSFNAALPNSLTNASSMFYGCTGLTSWNGTLPNSITEATQMFYNCSKLESFTVSMPIGLTKKARSMFYGCKLNLASVKKISETIQSCTGTSATDKTFTLGIAKSLEGNTEVQGYLQDIRNKGWTVEVSYNA